MRLSAYETYCLYLAIKSHFTTENYDYYKYQGKVRATKESFEIRRDRFQFQRLSRMYSDDQMFDFLVANFLHDIKWIGELLDDDAKANYLQYIKRKQAFTYTFANEVSKLFNTVTSPNKVFCKDNSSYPVLITSILSNEIGYDTASVMNKFFNFVPKFDRDLGTDDIIWRNIRLKIIKLHSLLDYDKSKIKKTLKETINI